MRKGIPILTHLVLLLCFVSLAAGRAAESIARNAVSLNGSVFVRTSLNSAELQINQNLTVEFWFKANAPGVLLSEFPVASSLGNAIIVLRSTGVVSATFPGLPAISIGTAQFGQWNHIALTYDRASGSFRGYLNGQSGGSTVGTRSAAATATLLYFLGRGGPENLSESRWLQGEIDEFRIWRVARTPAQILGAFDIRVSPSPELAALWHFDELLNPHHSVDSSSANNPAAFSSDAVTLVPSTAPIQSRAYITTEPATLSQTSATFTSRYNPAGSPMTIYFEWGPTIEYGSRSQEIDVGNGIEDLSMSLSLPFEDGQYHYRAVAVTPAGTIAGQDRAFLIRPADVATVSATVLGRDVDLRGTVSTPVGPVTAAFEWGPTTTYGNRSAEEAIPSARVNFPLLKRISVPSPGSYHFAVTAAAQDRSVRGANVAFNVPGPSPQTSAPILTATGARLLGRINTRGFDSTAWFEWGTTPEYGNRTAAQPVPGSGATDTPFEQEIAGLVRGQTYYFRLLAQAGDSIGLGQNVTFSAQPPTFEILAPTFNGPSATARAQVSTYGAATEARIEWGPTLDYGTITPPQFLSGNSVLFLQQIGSLQMGMTYNYRLLLSGPDGTIVGPNQRMTVPPPTALTLPPTTSGVTARLRGAINPRGFAGSYWFEWGSTETYGNRTPNTAFAAGATEIEVFRDIGPLSVGSTYHFRIAISSGTETFYGENLTWTMPTISATTSLPTGLGRATTLRGLVNGRGFPTVAWFEWGPTLEYGNVTPQQNVIGAGDVPINAAISPLDFAGTYHYRVVARSGDVTVRGANLSFAVPLPTAQTLPPTIAGSGARLRGSVDTRGFIVSAWFEWGPTLEYGNRTVPRDISGALTFEEPITDLAVAANYNCRLVLQYQDTVIRGANVAFTSSAPDATTAQPTIGGPAATLRGSIDRRGFAGAFWFEWGATEQYGNTTTPRAFPAGAALNVEDQISGLLPGRTYNFRLAVSSGDAIIRGRNLTFTVPAPTVQTLAAQTSGRSASLRTVINPRGFTVRAWHEWGETAAYGSTTPQLIFEGAANITFEQTVPDLTILAIYNFRGAVEYAGESFYGANQSFIVAPPEITTEAAVQSGVVQMRATIRTPLAASAYIEWGPTISYGNRTEWRDLTTTDGVATISHEELGLLAGTYHFRVAVRADGQVFYSPDAVFEARSGAGYAVPFTGSEYLRTAFATTSLFDDEDMTIELWFAARGPGVLLGDMDTSDPTRWDYAVAEILADGALRVGVPGAPPIDVGTVEFGAWRHLAIVYDDATDTLTAYLDARAAGSSVGDRLTARERGRSSFLTVGRGGPTNLGPGVSFRGVVDEWRIWRMARSASDIARLYRRTLDFYEPPNLVGYWRFDHFGAQVHSSPDSRAGGNQFAFYLPQRVPMPLEPSGAPLGPDVRPIVSQVTTRHLTPELIEVTAIVNPNRRATTLRFLAADGAVFERIDIPLTGAETVTVTNQLRLAAGAAQFSIRAANEAGETYTATFNAAPGRWAGTAVRFNPDTIDYVFSSAQLGTTLFPNPAFTVEAWIYPTSNGAVLSHDYGILFVNGRNERVHPAILEIANGELIAGLEGMAPVPVGPIAFNQWHHVAIRYNSENFRMDVYLNGANVGGVTGARTRSAFYRFNVGAQSAQGLTQPAGLPGFGGAVDEVRLWNLALPSEQIAFGRFNLLTGGEDGLVLNWRFDDSNWGDDAGPRGLVGEGVTARIASGAPLAFGLRRTGLLTFDLQFLAAPGTRNLVEWTTDFVSWQPLQQVDTPASGRVRLPASFAPNQPRFYRIRPAF